MTPDPHPIYGCECPTARHDTDCAGHRSLDDAIADELPEQPPTIGLAVLQLSEALATLNDLIDRVLPALMRASDDDRHADWCALLGRAGLAWAEALQAHNLLTTDLAPTDWRQEAGYL